MKKLFVASISISILYSFFFLLSPHANAQDFSLGVYPPILQIQANTPTAIKKDITVVNASDQPQDVSIVFRPFTQSPTHDGTVSYTAQVAGPDKHIFQKIQLLDNDNPITATTLAPRQKKTFTLHIGLPDNEPAGDYYFSILFLTNTTQDTSRNGSTINAGIATNVLLSVSPGPTTGFLDLFTSPWFVQTGPVPFTVSVSNTSNHYIAPTGHILIRNMFGQLIGTVTLVPVNILQNSVRYIPSKENAVQNGHPVALWNEKVLFGPYSARISVSLSDQGPLFVKTIYFFAMPVTYIIGFFIAVALVSIVLVRVRKKMNTL